MGEPLAVIRLAHADLELHGPDAGHEHGFCLTRFRDDLTVPAAPNAGETILDTVAHEAAHHIVAALLDDGPSHCLRAAGEGDGRRWTEARRFEETLACKLGPMLVQVHEAMRRAYG
jgi:hypothetical protein